jgi:CcmD family protein
MSNVTAAIVRRLGFLVFVLMCCAAPSEVAGAAQPPTQQQEEFLPLDQLPPTEQIPAARLLVAAYSFVLVAVFLYVVSVGRRLSTVHREIERLEADVKRSGRT